MRMSGAHGAWLHSSHAFLLSSSWTEQWARTATWITAALGLDEKVFYSTSVHDPLSGLAAAVAASLYRSSGRSQVEIIDAQARPAVLDEPATLDAWYKTLIDQARREGFRGAAFTGDMVPDSPKDRPRRVQRILAHERLAEQLTAQPGARVLCRYDPFEHPEVVQRLFAVHSSVDDIRWGADLIDGCLSICGEIDMGDVDGFRQVLYAAIDVGVASIDLAGVHLLSATAIGVLADAAVRLRRHHRQLVLLNSPPLILRTLEIAGFIGPPVSRPAYADATSENRRTGSPRSLSHPR